MDTTCLNYRQQSPLMIACEEEENELIRYLWRHSPFSIDFFYQQIKGNNVCVIKQIIRHTSLPEKWNKENNSTLNHLVKEKRKLKNYFEKKIPGFSN